MTRAVAGLTTWREIASRLGPAVTTETPLGERTTYRVGGPARLALELNDDADIDALADVVEATAVAVLVVGQGSNLLVADAGFDGVAVWLGERFDGWQPTDQGRVRLGAGARLPQVARQLARAGWTGFEWAVGVPGSVGGAVRMNAGGHGSDIAATLWAAEIVDLRTGRRRWWPAEELEFGYRRSAVRPHHLVVGAELTLARGDAAASQREIEQIVAWRRANQPGGANAGSVFTNPAGDSAGRLIDAAGCKGLRFGSASVSAKHANFIQVDSGGSAADVWCLMHLVRRRVARNGGPLLHPETIMVGFDEVFGSAAAELTVDAAMSQAGAEDDAGEGGG